MIEKLKQHKGSVVITVFALFMVGVSVFGYSQWYQKQAVLKSMEITFQSKNTIEYGEIVETKSFIKKVHGGTIKRYPTLHTKKLGKVKLTYTMEKNGYKKSFIHMVEIKDSKAPVITLKSEHQEIELNSEYDAYLNIEAVHDLVDGDLIVDKNAEAINESASENYNQMSKSKRERVEELLEKKIDRYAIETTVDKKAYQLFLKNTYYISGTVDVATVGDYTLRVMAVDKHGLKSEKTFMVTVKPLPEATPELSLGQEEIAQAGNGVSAPSAPRQSVEWLMNYASSMTGQKGWDCGDYVTHVLKEAGWLNKNAAGFANGGYNIAWQDLRPGDVVYFNYGPGLNHAVLITSNAFVNHTNGWNIYEWSIMQGGVGAEGRITFGKFNYDPEGNAEFCSPEKIKFLYVRRY